MSLKICVVSEAIESPFDEGVKIFVYNFIKQLAEEFEVLGLSRSDSYEGDIEKYCAKALPINKLFLSSFLWNNLSAFKPDVIYYIPTACATIYSFLRAKVLKLYGSGAKTIVITLQPREYSAISKKIIPFIVPDLVFAQSAKTLVALRNLGCKVKMIPTGVNLQKFTPVSKNMKESLRKRYGFPTHKYIILHVGHINRNRNMHFMVDVQRLEGTQVIVVGSKSGFEDGELVEELKKAGVIVIVSYIQDIEEIYQSSDCYLFPVFSEGACIEIPLSVFEAMACNLPVVTTKFGGLPNLLAEHESFKYGNTKEEIILKINFVKSKSGRGTRHLIENYSWENIVKSIIEDSNV